MKKILATFAIATLFASCGPDYKSQVEQMKSERDSILVEFSLRDSLINSYMKDVGEIQQQVAELTRQEGILNEQITGNELSRSQKQKVLDDIESLRNLIDAQKNKLSSLQSKISKSKTKIDELEKMIVVLNSQLASRDSNICFLTEQIASLNGKVAEMDTAFKLAQADNRNKSLEIADKTKKLNTAYFVVGNYKSLKTQKVLSQDGKFLGMAKNKSINSDFNQTAFTQLDVTDTKIIDVFSTKAELLSTHPTGSYAFVKQGEKIIAIEITDSQKFWQASKYLVVMTN